MPGRNDPCPCGSGRKFKHCCLARVEAGDFMRQRMRGAEGRIPDLVTWAAGDWGREFVAEAWDAFFEWDEVPELSPDHPDFESLFFTWLVFRFVAEPPGRNAFGTPCPGEPLALHYIEHRAGAFSDFERQFLAAAARSPFSVWSVTRADPGRAMDLEDVLTGEPCTVLERSASQTVLPGALLFARVVTLDGVSILVGCAPLVIPPAYRLELVTLREELAGRGRRPTRDDVWAHDADLRGWYHAVADALRNPPLPRLQNTDGDPLAPTMMYFTLGCAPGEAFDRLRSLNGVERDPEALLAEGDAEYDASGELCAFTISWMKRGNRLHKDWDNTVLGHLTIDRRSLHASVNSAKRARKLQKEIEKRLGDRVIYERSVVESVDRLLQQARAHGPRAGGQAADVADVPPEAQEMLSEMLRRHWEQWLDERVPALGNRTPREAAKTAGGRELLDALFADFAWRNSNQPEHQRAPVEELRARLGLSK